MSAFEISALHIDAMLYAGLTWGMPHRHSGPIGWQARELTEEEVRGAYERGEVWGPEAIRIARSLRRELTQESANRVGAMLMAENRRSLDHRYDEDELEQVYEYRANFGHFSPDPVTVLKAIRCYVYQSCEHPEWEASEAKRFCDALMIRAIYELPGFDEADGWEVHSREVFRDAVARRGLHTQWMTRANTAEQKLAIVQAVLREARNDEDISAPGLAKLIEAELDD